MSDVQTPADRLDQLERAVRILFNLLKAIEGILPGAVKLLIGNQLHQLASIVQEFPK